MKYLILSVIALTFLMSCESENVDDLLPPAKVQPVSNSTDSTATDTTASGGATVSFARDINPLIQSTCATPGCHAARANSPELTSYTLIEASKDRVISRIRLGSMPPSGPLPQRQKDLIQTWIDEGALNN
jgi:hypothetical protein